jgi:aspartyl/asparaginyl beta-hydroxylase (cupin superfamily)
MALASTDELMSDLRSRLGDDGLDRVEECLRIFAGEVEPTYLHDDQEPTRLFFPGIEARPWFGPERFDWVPIVEAAFGPIRAELDALVSEQARFSPYEDPHTKELGWAGWETFSLYRNGVVDEDAWRRCPATVAALEATPHGPREAMFTTMRPGTHITPHTGGANPVLTCHLGLIVPPDCGIGVNGDVRTWQEGKCLVFDDSFMHEAWNRGPGMRAVLLWDVWHPDLSPKEIAALEILLPQFVKAMGGF